MKHALKEKIKSSLVKLSSYTTNSLCKCGTISIEGLIEYTLSVYEIDTILLLRTRLLTDSGQKPILQQNYTQVDRDKQG